MNGSVNIFRVCMSCKHNGGGAKCQGVIDSGAPRLYRSRESDSCAGLSHSMQQGVCFLCMKPRGQWKWAAHITPFEAFWITEHWTTLSGVFSISEPFQHSSDVRFKEVQSQVHHFLKFEIRTWALEGTFSEIYAHFFFFLIKYTLTCKANSTFKMCFGAKKNSCVKTLLLHQRSVMSNFSQYIIITCHYFFL